MTSSDSRSTFIGSVRGGWPRRAERLTAVAIAASGAVALIAAIALPHAIATHPFLGLAFMVVIAVAVMSVLALTQRWDRRWPLFGMFLLVTLAGYVLGRVDHVVPGRSLVAMLLLAVAVAACSVIVWPSKRRRR
jgi:FtsH-binding integral membrane protein